MMKSNVFLHVNYQKMKKPGRGGQLRNGIGEILKVKQLPEFRCRLN